LTIITKSIVIFDKSLLNTINIKRKGFCMAEEKKEEANNKEEKGEGEATEKKEGGNKTMIIIIGAVVAVLLIVGVVVAVLLSGDEEEAPVAGVAPTQKTNSGAGSNKPVIPISRANGRSFTEVGTLYEMKRFTVNLLSDKGRKYVRCTMSLELSSPELMGELDSKKPAVRDSIINVLSSKTYEEISTTKGKERLKDEIVATLNQSLVDGTVKNLFFTELMIQ
jgi:flagellar FliL protein